MPISDSPLIELSFVNGFLTSIRHHKIEENIHR